jgi:hypothetical protein
LSVPTILPLIAGTSASIKFLLLFLALIYWPTGLIGLIVRRRTV